MKLNIMRYKLFEEHMKLVKVGRCEVARRILRFLRDKKICLWLSDADWETEQILYKLGFRVEIGRNGNKSTVYYEIGANE